MGSPRSDHCDRRLLHPEPRQQIKVGKDPIAREDGADPAALGIPKRLSAELLGNSVFTEPFRMPLLHAAVHEPAGICLLLEIETAATEKEIHADADIGVEERAPRRLRRRVLRRVGPGDNPGIGVRLLDGLIPDAMEFVLPVIREGGFVFRREVARDVARAADHAPVEPHGLPVRGEEMAPERQRELGANRLVVRRDDDDRPVRLEDQVFLWPERKRRADNHGEGADQEQGPNHAATISGIPEAAAGQACRTMTSGASTTASSSSLSKKSDASRGFSSNIFSTVESSADGWNSYCAISPR